MRGFQYKDKEGVEMFLGKSYVNESFTLLGVTLTRGFTVVPLDLMIGPVLPLPTPILLNRQSLNLFGILNCFLVISRYMTISCALNDFSYLRC